LSLSKEAWNSTVGGELRGLAVSLYFVPEDCYGPRGRVVSSESVLV
jgi:hypothetical protein